MKLVSWNVNGLRACVEKGFMDIFKELDADFFCIQESKLQEGQIQLDLPGYYQYWNYAKKKGYSGTAIFTKHEPLNVILGIGIEEHDHEGRVVTLEYDNYYVITVYTPNSQDGLKRLDYRMKWEEDFCAYLKKLEENKPVIFCGDLNNAHQSYIPTTKHKPVIVCGDFNVAANPIDLKNPKSNQNNAGYTLQEREAFKNLLQSGFVDTYRHLNPNKVEYSWWSYRFKAREKNAGWRLDYFLLSEFAKNKIVDAKIHTDIMGSDHCPVSLEIDI